DHGPPVIARAESAFVEPNIEAGAAQAALEALHRFHILARVTHKNRRRFAWNYGGVHFRRSGFLGKRFPFFRELVDELDRVRDPERFRLRTEVVQEIAQMHIGDDGAVRDELPRFVAAVETVAAAKPNEETRQPVGMRVTDEQQPLGAQLVEEIREPARHRFLMQLPDELERLFVDQRAVRNARDLAEKMKDDAVRRARVIARDVAERGVWSVSEDVDGRSAERVSAERTHRRADEQAQRLDRGQLTQRLRN